MKSAQLLLDKFKIAKLNDPSNIRGGGGDGQTIIPQCIKTSKEYVFEIYN